MRIYYFGELIADTENPIQTAKKQQTSLPFDSLSQESKRASMDSIGDILNELDLTRDSFRSAGMRQTHA